MKIVTLAISPIPVGYLHPHNVVTQALIFWEMFLNYNAEGIT